MTNRIRRTHTVWFDGAMHKVPEGYKERARELWGQDKSKGNHSGATRYANYIRAFVLMLVENGTFADRLCFWSESELAEFFHGAEIDVNDPPKGFIDWVIDAYSPVRYGLSIHNSFAPTQFDREWGEDKLIDSLNWWDEIHASADVFQSLFKSVK